MYRIGLLVVIAVALTLGVFQWAPSRSEASLASQVVTPTPVPECEAVWEDADVRPHFRPAAVVVPGTPAPAMGATPTPDDDRELYLVTISLPPGGCIPFTAPPNQRNGAVVLIIQQGKVAYQWMPVDDAPPDSTPVITRGNEDALEESEFIDLSELPGTTQVLFPGDWITQDRQVQITFTNIGGDTAIILKAAFALPPPLGGGCGGDCK